MGDTSFLAFVLANVGVVAIGGLLAGLSLVAYRHSDDGRPYLLAMLGFGCVVFGGLVESLYTLGFEPQFLLTSGEFVRLQIAEDALLGVGLGLVFLAITRHDSGSDTATERTLPADDRHWNVDRRDD